MWANLLFVLFFPAFICGFSVALCYVAADIISGIIESL